jgi:hypothetical protein
MTKIHTLLLLLLLLLSSSSSSPSLSSSSVHPVDQYITDVGYVTKIKALYLGHLK